MKTIAVSGGFDPVHSGHINMFRAAAEYGRVVVFLNTDKWLSRKKGQPFMSFKERYSVLIAIRHIDVVFPAWDDDDTVCWNLRHHKPDYFANGGDRKENNTPELEVCKELGIQPLFNIGGDNKQSSSRLLDVFCQSKKSLGTL
jgi:cytidyltransferase-like protein